jgi:hypothetical protein
MKNYNILKTMAIAVFFMAGGIANAGAAMMLGSHLPTPADVKVWIVPLDLSGPEVGGNFGVNAVLPVPAAAPDLTFQTTLIQYSSDNKPNTIQGFFVPGSVDNPVFSNQFNSAFQGVVDANTLLTQQDPQDPSRGWGAYMEFTGIMLIKNGDFIGIEHDDGVSLSLNNVPTGCFSAGSGSHYLSSTGPEYCDYNGPTGFVPFDLIYTEGYTEPARLSVYVPEPPALGFLGLGFLGLMLFRRRMSRG